jgi:hypothetical protein
MIKCRSFKNRFVEALYGKLPPRDRKTLEDHLSSCPKCAAEYEAAARTLKIMDRHEVPDPGPEFWDGYWTGFERRLERERRGGPIPVAAKAAGRGFLGFVPKWAWTAASAVVLLAAGAAIGRFFLGRPVSTIPRAFQDKGGLVSNASHDALIDGASRYLDRSKVLLIALVNRDAADDPAALDLVRQKRVSDQLIKEAAVLKRGLEQSAGPEDRRLARLISDLEVILLQIANLESKSDSSAVDIIKLGVQNQGLIFQINLSQMRLDKTAGAGSRSGGSALPKVKSAV